MTTPNNESSFAMGLHAPGILSLLSSGVYGNDETVALRELCQNAHDSVTKRRAQEPGFVGSVRFALRWQDHDLFLVVSDEGIGMDENDIREFLSQVGRSGTADERVRLRAENNRLADELIGNFGIGFLSVFMLADQARVHTRKLGEPMEAGLEWENTGDTLCQLRTSPKEATGTDVWLRLKPDTCHLTEEDIAHSLRRFALFLDVPIWVGAERINKPAPWLTPRFPNLPQEAQAALVEAYFRQRYPRLIPFDVWHFRLELPEVVEGMLYITDEFLPGEASSQGIELYVRRMFLREGLVELLPEWTRAMVRGIITTDALQPNAARDNVHQDELFERLRNSLAQVVLERLGWLAQNERNTFFRLCRAYGGGIKGAAYHDDDFFELVADQLAFVSNAAEGLLTLKEYRNLSQPDPESELRPLFYFTDRDGGSLYFPLARHAGLTILDGSGHFDEALLRRYATAWRGLTPVRLDSADDPRLLGRLRGYELDAFLPLASAIESQLTKLGLQRVTVTVRRFAPEDVPVMVFADSRELAGGMLRQSLEETPRSGVLMELSDLFHEAANQVSGLSLQFQLNADNPLVHQLQSASLECSTVKRVLGAVAIFALDRTERLRDLYQPLIQQQQLLLAQELLSHAV